MPIPEMACYLKHHMYEAGSPFSSKGNRLRIVNEFIVIRLYKRCLRPETSRWYAPYTSHASVGPLQVILTFQSTAPSTVPTNQHQYYWESPCSLHPESRKACG
jgi:hypothetical protein